MFIGVVVVIRFVVRVGFCVVCHVFVFLNVFGRFTLSRKPRRVFKSFLGAVARYTQILSPWRAMATPFVSKVIEKPRNCASGSLFKSPVAPTATRFKQITVFFQLKPSFGDALSE